MQKTTIRIRKVTFSDANIVRMHHGNRYMPCGDASEFMIRDFTVHDEVPYLAMRPLPMSDSAYKRRLENAAKNNVRLKHGVGSMRSKAKSAIIVGHGYDHKSMIERINAMKSNNAMNDVIVLGYGKTLIHGLDADYYFCNDPTPECNHWLPQKSNKWPVGVFSLYCDPIFVRDWQGGKYFYTNPPVAGHKTPHRFKSPRSFLSDYFVITCAMCEWCWKLGMRNIIMAGTDLSFTDKRPGSVSAGSDFYVYPHHLKAYSVIGACIYFLRGAGMNVVNCSFGQFFDNVPQIRIDQALDALMNGDMPT